MRVPFVWEEMEHWTTHDVQETLQLISTDEEAMDFFEKYADVCDDEDHALHNIGYIAEIIRHKDEAEGDRICALFDVKYKIEPRQLFAGSSCGVKS